MGSGYIHNQLPSLKSYLHGNVGEESMIESRRNNPSAAFHLLLLTTDLSRRPTLHS